MSNWYVYILKCADDSLYTGISNNFEKRLKDHKEGRGAKYMRGRSPFKLVYLQHLPSRSEASKHEYYIKSLTREKKLALVSKGHGLRGPKLMKSYLL